MNNSPIISVIVPVYNVEKYLGRCLDSILKQDLQGMEIICVDDGSTDNSPDILRNYAMREPRIRVITQENRGVSSARNAGLDAAKGQWISFLDSDDELLPGAYSQLLEHCGDEDFICFGAEEVYQQGEELNPIFSGYFEVRFSGMRMLEDKDLLKLPMTVWDKIFRRSRIEECVLRFPEGLHFEDNVFILNFTGVYRKARFIPQKYYRYFRREGSFMDSVRNRKKNLAFDHIMLLESIHSFWAEHNLFPQINPVFEQLCFNMLRAAIDICQPWERPGIAYTLAASLRRWDFKPKRKELLALREGTLTIRLGAFLGKEITLLKPLRGLQKILYVGNCQGKRILCLFSMKVASWEK